MDKSSTALPKREGYFIACIWMKWVISILLSCTAPPSALTALPMSWTALSADVAHHSYPPYNIEKNAEDTDRIFIAVAGFDSDDLNVEVKEGQAERGSHV
jgi:hypothetical protein